MYLDVQFAAVGASAEDKLNLYFKSFPRIYEIMTRTYKFSQHNIRIDGMKDAREKTKFV